jgi:hypothetical protein
MRTFFRIHYFIEGVSHYCDKNIKEGNVGDDYSNQEVEPNEQAELIFYNVVSWNITKSK